MLHTHVPSVSGPLRLSVCDDPSGGFAISLSTTTGATTTGGTTTTTTGTTTTGGPPLASVLLERAEHDLLVPRRDATAGGSLLDERTSAIIGRLPSTPLATALLPHVIDYFLTGVLAPAVIVSSDSISACEIVDALTGALQASLGEGIRMIRGVDPLVVKMNRALYDACDARSLRDEILDLQARRSSCNGSRHRGDGGSSSSISS